MVVVGLIDLRIWLRLSYPIYGVALVLLIAVEIVGEIGMGAQRWIDLGIIQIQPSEIMKIAIVLALARYFHGASLEEVGRPTFLIVPLLMVLAPVGLVMKQPDLGTALMVMMVGGAIFFLVGVRLWKFAIVARRGRVDPGGVAVPARLPEEPGADLPEPGERPAGAGYHITQSKIALGSGGVAGKGYMMGSQSHLNFLPEKQTDFIFTMLAEELGMIGGTGLLLLYSLLIAYGVIIALRCRNQFGRLVGLGVSTNLFLYVFINIAMVMGLIPVVGIPCP